MESKKSSDKVTYSIQSLGEGGWSRENFFIYFIPYVWVIVFLLLPLLIIFKISVSESQIGILPYKPIVCWTDNYWPEFNITFAKFKEIMGDSVYLSTYFFSLKVACLTTIFTLLLGYPIAYAISNLSSVNQYRVLILILIPFWTSFLVRVYAWIAILKDKGFLNYFLLKLGIISEPLQILYTEFAIYVGMVYAYLPFLIIPIYSSLIQIDKSLIEAAQNLGCTRYQAFWKIVFPMSLNGVMTGCLLVFIPAIGDFVIPDILGSPDSIMLGNSLWSVFFNQIDWPGAMVIVVLMVVLLMVPIGLFYLFSSLGFVFGRFFGRGSSDE